MQLYSHKIAGIFFQVFLLLSLLLVACEADDNLLDLEDPSGSTPEYGIVIFWATHFNRIRLDGTLERFKITTEFLIKRERQGQTIRFNNYDELFFSKAILEQYVNSPIVQFNMNEIMNLAGRDNKSVTDKRELSHAEPEILGHKLNRVLVDQITINFRPEKRSPIVLTAEHGKVLTDSMVMAFDGDFRLKSVKCRIMSDSAIWSNQYNGLLLSKPYQLNKKTYRTPAFYQISDTGQCKKVQPAPTVEYIDQLEIIETKMLEALPMSVKLIFGLTGVNVQSLQAK